MNQRPRRPKRRALAKLSYTPVRLEYTRFIGPKKRKSPEAVPTAASGDFLFFGVECRAQEDESECRPGGPYGALEIVLAQFASTRSGRSNRPRSARSECAAGGRYGALNIAPRSGVPDRIRHAVPERVSARRAVRSDQEIDLAEAAPRLPPNRGDWICTSDLGDPNAAL